MVVPDQIAIAAQAGDVAAVEAWLNEGGDVNERNTHDDPLLLICAATPGVRTTSHTIPRIITMLLRAGASLDAVSDERAAETELREIEKAKPDLRDNDAFVQIKALICGVRAAGSWKAYCRQDHKEILRLRSLVTRGRARERLAATPAIKFILRRADNGVLWTILSFWQATN
jgi:hypothetical protein